MWIQNTVLLKSSPLNLSIRLHLRSVGSFNIKSLVPRLFKVASKKKCLINECSKRLGELL